MADLTVASSHTATSGRATWVSTYTLTATNSGTGPTSGTVRCGGHAPAGLTATKVLCGTGWTVNFGALTASRSDVLAPGMSYPPLVLTVNVSATAAAGLTNMATVSGGGEVVTSNDAASDPTTIVQLADLTLTATHAGNFTQGDVGDTYTLTATNSARAPPAAR